jgi:uncharacterized protein YfaP (DUF2135 family)
MRTLTICLVLATGFAACKYPAPSKNEQEDRRPSIGIEGAPAGATLFVDGLNMGLASKFDGKEHVLLVESGTHRVEVKSADGKLLHAETVFLGSSTTKILVIQP